MSADTLFATQLKLKYTNAVSTFILLVASKVFQYIDIENENTDLE